MLVLEVWLPLLLIAAIGAGWYHVLRLRERVTAHARQLCERHGLQLLDDNVALHRLRVRLRRGGLHALREYRFETSLGGNDRQTASLTMFGDRVVGASLPARERLKNVVPAPVPVPRISALPTPASGSDAGDNAIPIERARRTLH